MSEPAKCGRCRGFGFEPDVTPMATCTSCKGTGRAAAPPPAAANQQELIDG